MEAKIRHLEMIQNVINRMASNSFVLKGWAVTLLVGFFALSSKDATAMFIFLAEIPLLAFWGLDAYYLMLERAYRGLFDKVKEKTEDKIDFSMKVKFEEKSKMTEWIACVKSASESGFYLPLVAVCLVIGIYVCCL